MFFIAIIQLSRFVCIAYVIIIYYHRHIVKYFFIPLSFFIDNGIF